MKVFKKPSFKTFLLLVCLLFFANDARCSVSALTPMDSSGEFELVLAEIKDIALPILKAILWALKFLWKSVDTFFVTKYKLNQAAKSAWESHYVQKTTNFFWPSKQ